MPCVSLPRVAFIRFDFLIYWFTYIVYFTKLIHSSTQTPKISTHSHLLFLFRFSLSVSVFVSHIHVHTHTPQHGHSHSHSHSQGHSREWCDPPNMNTCPNDPVPTATAQIPLRLQENLQLLDHMYPKTKVRTRTQARTCCFFFFFSFVFSSCSRPFQSTFPTSFFAQFSY